MIHTVASACRWLDAMNTFSLRNRLTVSRLQQAVERSIVKRHARQQIRFESSQSQPPNTTRKVSTLASEPRSLVTLLHSKPWFNSVMVPVRAYDRAHRRRPYIVQLISTMVIYFLGDLSAQAIATANFTEGPGYEPVRSLRSVTIGGLAAVPSYIWFVYLATNFNFASKLAGLAVKIGINQMLFTPLFSAYFFGMQSLLTGTSLQEAWKRIQDTVPVSWLNSWKVWPAVMAFNFTYVPLQFRSIFAGFIAVGWQSYLSWLNKKAETMEKLSDMEESSKQSSSRAVKA